MDADISVYVALPKMNPERRPHEDGVEFLALNQTCVLLPGIGRVSRRRKYRPVKELKRVNCEIEQGERREYEHARGKKGHCKGAGADHV
jgi:hypothetical protein